MKLSLLFCYLLYFTLFASVILKYPASAFDKEKSYTTKGEGLPIIEPQPPLISSPEELSEFRDINKIEFLWRNVPTVAGYHIILAKDRTFKNIIHENSRVAGTSYTIENLDFGTYFFKVSSVSSNGAEGPFSDTLTFIIIPPPPTEIPRR